MFIVESSRLFSICYDGNYVGGTRSSGEFGIGFGSGKRKVRCSAPDTIPDICEEEPATPESTLISYETTEALSDQELCDCFSLDLVSSERDGARMCYTYRLEDTCSRSSDFVRFFISADDMAQCGISIDDLPNLVVGSSPSDASRSISTALGA